MFKETIWLDAYKLKEVKLETIFPISVGARSRLVVLFSVEWWAGEGILKAFLVFLFFGDGCNIFGVSGEVEAVSAQGKGSGDRGFINGAGEIEL